MQSWAFGNRHLCLYNGHTFAPAAKKPGFFRKVHLSRLSRHALGSVTDYSVRLCQVLETTLALFATGGHECALAAVQDTLMCCTGYLGNKQKITRLIAIAVGNVSWHLSRKTQVHERLAYTPVVSVEVLPRLIIY